MNSPMAARRSICRGRRRAIRGTRNISPPDRAAAPEPRVAAGLILGGIGTDTGGSIRGPAALCGIAGIKPTYGLVCRAGVAPAAFSLDHIGPMAWTAEDCAMMLAGARRSRSARSRQRHAADPGLHRAAWHRHQGRPRRRHPAFPRKRTTRSARRRNGHRCGHRRRVRSLGAAVSEVTLSPLQNGMPAGR